VSVAAEAVDRPVIGVDRIGVGTRGYDRPRRRRHAGDAQDPVFEILQDEIGRERAERAVAQVEVRRRAEQRRGARLGCRPQGEHDHQEPIDQLHG
jgi:hypothetical protein